jgi:hypothetical protein
MSSVVHAARGRTDPPSRTRRTGEDLRQIVRAPATTGEHRELASIILILFTDAR